nr:MAG TPA: hypothetical protein [Caudoviricetes sp.]
MYKKVRIYIVDTIKTTYKVVAPSGVFIRSTPQQEDDNVVRLAECDERLTVIDVGDEWVKTNEGYVMNEPYIIEPDSSIPKIKKGESE